MSTKRAPLPTAEMLDMVIATLRAQRRRHAEALAEIDATLRQLDVTDEPEVGDDVKDTLEQVNQRYGDVLRRLA